MTSPGDLEARVAALEAAMGQIDRVVERLDDVAAKVNANGEAIDALRKNLAGHRQETRQWLDSLERRLDTLGELTRAIFGSVEEQVGEVKDLLADLGGRV
jgi:ABC-type transporter Mla subunit MlaD